MILLWVTRDQLLLQAGEPYLKKLIKKKSNVFLYRDTNVADRTPNCVNLLFVVHETGVQFLVEAAGLSTRLR